MATLALLALLLRPASAPAAQGDAAAALYVDKCAACHSVGTSAELDGPDLAPTAKWSATDLGAAISRMAENVGELPANEVATLVAFLQSGHAKERLAAQADAGKGSAGEGDAAGSVARGEALYWGDAPLAAGGMACFACHAVDGAGGTLGPDLTGTTAKVGQVALVSAIGNARYNVMRAPYADHPISREEATDLAAYLGSTTRASRAVPVGPLVVVGLVVVVFMLATAFVASRRSRLTRAALLRYTGTKR